MLAHVVDAETAAVDYVHGGDGLLMAPAYAVPRLLARNGLTLQDFDFYEIHEAFASTVLATLAGVGGATTFCRERLGLDAPLGPDRPGRLNVNGSSLAAGHPFAATGGRIVATLAKLLHEKGSGRGLISICAAGGQGVVAILRRALTTDRSLPDCRQQWPFGKQPAAAGSGCRSPRAAPLRARAAAARRPGPGRRGDGEAARTRSPT